MQEEEILGKAYDARLMRRLLKYLRPYRWQVVLGILLSILVSAMEAVRPTAVLTVMVASFDVALPPQDPERMARYRWPFSAATGAKS